MKASALKYAILTTAACLAMLIIVLLPFHAFLTVWISSGTGHYTTVRLWKEVLLAICLLSVVYLVLFDKKIRRHTLSRRLIQLVILYTVVNVGWGFVAFQRHDVNLKAVSYGMLLNLRFLAFFMICWAIALRTQRLQSNWQKLLLWPSAIVVLFGLLQALVLPTDFLSHFGYGPKTIPPYETINNNIHYIRIASTLRGANPLGAYLILPISALCMLLTRKGWAWSKVLLLVGSLGALYFSFSRSAWIGAILSMAFIFALRLRGKTKTFVSYGGIIVVIIVLGLVLALHKNMRFENIFLHTQSHSAVATTSDQGHVSALRSGIHDIVHQPLGRGPGSAGPASIYNNHPSRIAENYYIQIGQETGWLGLALFLLINAGVGYLLWLRRQDPLALSLLAAFIGISFVNLLSHAWADDTLAYVWWGLAGIAMARLPDEVEKHHAS